MRGVSDTHGYLVLVRDAHDMATLLKESRPHFRAEIEELQRIVTRAHLELEDLDGKRENGKIGAGPDASQEAAALNNLKAAHHSLGELKKQILLAAPSPAREDIRRPQMEPG